MSKIIIISVVCGILTGAFLIPNLEFGHRIIDLSGSAIMIALCALLLLVGFEIGRDVTVRERIKKVGFRVFLFPVAAVAGTYIFTAAAALFLPISPREAMAAAGGFGWYSFAPNILMAYSTTISAICFLLNVMRELSGIVLIPIIAKRVGYIEAIALPGVAVGDICLPVIEKSASGDMVIYAIVMGLSMTLAVPWVGVIVGL